MDWVEVSTVIKDLKSPLSFYVGLHNRSPLFIGTLALVVFSVLIGIYFLV